MKLLFLVITIFFSLVSSQANVTTSVVPPPVTSVVRPPVTTSVVPPPVTSVVPPPVTSVVPPPVTTSVVPPPVTTSLVPPPVTTSLVTTSQAGTPTSPVTQPSATNDTTSSASTAASGNGVIIGVSIGLVLLVLGVIGILIFRNGIKGIENNKPNSNNVELQPIEYPRQSPGGDTPMYDDTRRKSMPQSSPGYGGAYFDAQGNFNYEASPAQNRGNF